ncbi:MAG: hypothetical protein ACI4TD_00385 [Phocaeicola sp.]
MNRKQLWLLIFLLFAGVALYAQVPKAINYQAVAYEADGNVVADKQISVKLAILQGGAEGTAVYEETHQVHTAANGVFNLQIGTGTIVSGAFSLIDWSQSPYYVQFSLDTQGGSSYRKVATSQMLSVPYALYAERAGSVDGGSESGINPFTIMPINGPAGKLLSGSDEEISGDPSFFIAYNNDINQEVTYRIEGLPNYVSINESSSSLSGPNGQYLFFALWYDNRNAITGTHNCRIIFENNQGFQRVYPFKFVTVTRDWNYDQFGTDESTNNAVSMILQYKNTCSQLFETVDEAFFTAPSNNQYTCFYNKTYDPNSEILPLILDNISLENDVESLLYSLEEVATSPNLSESVKNSAIVSAKVAKAYLYLMRVSYWGQFLSYRTGDVLSQTEALEVVISLLTAALAIDNENAEALTLLGEAYLLVGKWQEAANLTSSAVLGSLDAFIFKIAQWKQNNSEDVTEASLMSEFMDNYYTSHKRGHLFLRILDYFGQYFNLDESDYYKKVLPFPASDVRAYDNLTQNPGY